jgi:hypothetical protein
MGQTLLVEQIRDGETLVRALLDDGVDVQAAFWMAEDDTSVPLLHIVSDDLPRLGPLETYRKIGRVMRRMDQPFWIPFDGVNLVDPSRPLGQDVLERLSRNPGPLPLRGGGEYLGGDYVNQYFIYPSTVLAH